MFDIVFYWEPALLAKNPIKAPAHRARRLLGISRVGVVGL
jgi:hypothetical protein